MLGLGVTIQSLGTLGALVASKTGESQTGVSEDVKRCFIVRCAETNWGLFRIEQLSNILSGGN